MSLLKFAAFGSLLKSNLHFQLSMAKFVILVVVEKVALVLVVVVEVRGEAQRLTRFICDTLNTIVKSIAQIRLARNEKATLESERREMK